MAQPDKNDKTLWGRVKYYIWWLHLQYLLTTGLYMLETWERVIFNTILLGFLSMAAYSTYVFLPGRIASFLQMIGLLNNNSMDNNVLSYPGASFSGKEL